MKKFLTALCSICLSVIMALSFAACSNSDKEETSSIPNNTINTGNPSDNPTDEPTDGTPPTNPNDGPKVNASDLNVVTTKCVVQQNDNYKNSVQAFYDNKFNYWVYALGSIIDVPLDITFSYIRYGGGNLKREITTTKTSASSVKTVSEQSAKNVTSWSKSHSINVEGSIGFDIKRLISVNIGVGYNYTRTDGGSNTDEWSKTFEDCESYSETNAVTTTLIFDESCEKGYYSYTYVGVVNVYATIIQDKATDKFYKDTYTEVKGYGYSMLYNADSPEFENNGTEKLDFDLSLIESLPVPTVRLPSEVVPQGTIKIPLIRESCKLDNGFDPSESGSERDSLAHKDFELVELYMENSVKGTDGKYYVPKSQQPYFYLKLLKNIDKLPVGPQLGSVNWTIHYVCDDNYANAVYGTNITGERVGKGAYYVKVNYTDGTFSESKAVNVLNGAAENNLLAVDIDFKSGKVLKSIEVIFVYELYYDYMSHIFDWVGTKCYANWRCSANLQFGT